MDNSIAMENIETASDQVQVEPQQEPQQEPPQEPQQGPQPKPERKHRSFRLSDNVPVPPKPAEGTSNENGEKNPIMDLPIEIIQTLQQLSSPKLGHTGLPTRPKPMRIEDGKAILPDLPPLQQCQQLQQIQSLIHYHEQQVKYRSYLQLELLRNLRKQLSDQMMLHPPRAHYEALVQTAKEKRLTPLSLAEKTQIEYFTSMADWTLDARSILQDKESPFYLLLIGRQINDFKVRLNEITTHEQFLVFAPMLAERIDYHRELIHVLNRRSSVSIM